MPGSQAEVAAPGTAPPASPASGPSADRLSDRPDRRGREGAVGLQQHGRGRPVQRGAAALAVDGHAGGSVLPEQPERDPAGRGRRCRCRSGPEATTTTLPGAALAVALGSGARVGAVLGVTSGAGTPVLGVAPGVADGVGRRGEARDARVADGGRRRRRAGRWRPVRRRTTGRWATVARRGRRRRCRGRAWPTVRRRRAPGVDGTGGVGGRLGRGGHRPGRRRRAARRRPTVPTAQTASAWPAATVTTWRASGCCGPQQGAGGDDQAEHDQHGDER